MLLYSPLNMSNLVKEPRRLICFINYLIQPKNHRYITTRGPLFVNNTPKIRLSRTHSKTPLLGADQFWLILSRNQSKVGKRGKTRIEDESSDEEDEVDNEEGDLLDDSNIKMFRVKSLRIDSVLKASLGISRKKVEQCFYENKIRVNGKIVNKKSQNANVNDDVDLIIGFARNSDQLNVNRIKILKVESNPDNTNLTIKVLKLKCIKISNYEDGDSWKEPVEENS